MANTDHSSLTGTNVHTPITWTYADKTAREAATGLTSGDLNKFALQSDENSIWILIDESPVTWSEVGATAGAVAPDDAKYIVATANASLSSEIVIPGLAGSPDIVGAGGAGTSEEYDSATTGLTWTTAPNTVDSNTTILSHLYIKNTDATEKLGTKSYAPTGAFDARCKVTLGNGITNIAAIGLLICDDDNSERAMIQLMSIPGSQAFQVKAYTYTLSSYTQRGSSWGVGVNQIYFRIARDGSNNVSFYFSVNGILWQLVATQSFTLTVAKLGFRIANDSTLTSEMAVDWLRTDV